MLRRFQRLAGVTVHSTCSARGDGVHTVHSELTTESNSCSKMGIDTLICGARRCGAVARTRSPPETVAIVVDMTRKGLWSTSTTATKGGLEEEGDGGGEEGQNELVANHRWILYTIGKCVPFVNRKSEQH